MAVRHRVRLILWKPDAEKTAAVRALGYGVEDAKPTSSSLKEFRENPPDAIVIDLSRLPATGLEVGVALRRFPKTRLIPLVFVDGLPEKVARAQAALPDARYTTYAKLGPVLGDVLAAPPREAVVPKSISGPDSPVPLAKKLGIKDEVALVNAPKDFAKRLGEAKVTKNAALTIWFVKELDEFTASLKAFRACAARGGIWICWPKGQKNGLNGNHVREACLEVGLVDFKICAVDAIWSGMRFAVRKGGR